MADLKSDTLSTATFDAEREVIQIRFRNGADYEYSADKAADPPTDMRVMYLSLIHADSPGKFFVQNIRGKLPFRKIEHQEASK